MWGRDKKHKSAVNVVRFRNRFLRNSDASQSIEIQNVLLSELNNVSFRINIAVLSLSSKKII